MSLLEKAVVGSNEECFVALLNLKKAPYTADDMRRALVISEFAESFMSAAAQSSLVPEVDDVYVKRAEDAVYKMGTYDDDDEEQDDEDDDQDDCYSLQALAMLVTKQATGNPVLHVYHALKQLSQICFSSMGFDLTDTYSKSTVDDAMRGLRQGLTILGTEAKRVHSGAEED